MTTVLTLGTFGVPHIGHALFLRLSERFGSVTVGVNSDGFVEHYKGHRPPFNQDERMALIASLGYRVVLNDGPGREVIDAERPRIITIGTDWADRDYLAQIDVTAEWLMERGIRVEYIEARPIGISSSEIIRRLRS